MPIKVNIVDHPATKWRKPRVSSAEELLKQACPREHGQCQKVVQTSFTRSQLREGGVTAFKNGFVLAAFHAYSSHHHLRLRPEDVWFAILAQLSFFINAHAEELRAFFVPHRGKKELEVVHHVADFSFIAKQMSLMIAKNVNDPELREWVMPSFTTTTDCDRVVGSVLFMGAMQKYFSYGVRVQCGLPSITLLGEVDDWRDILGRLDKIDQFGDEPALFAKMLRPVLRRMVLTFEDPTSAEVTHFWNTIVDREWLGSGSPSISGWLAAFCFWDERGKAKQLLEENFLLESVRYPTVDECDVPTGFASVPVKVDDDGDEYEATMVAGSVGILSIVSDRPLVSEQDGDSSGLSSSPLGSRVQQQIPDDVTTSGQQADPELEIRDTVQPLSGWWMYENETETNGVI